MRNSEGKQGCAVTFIDATLLPRVCRINILSRSIYMNFWNSVMLKYLFTIVIITTISFPSHAKTILIIGDSISAGYGIEIKDGWVALLDEKLNQQGEFTVVNASVSGDTTGMGLARTESLLSQHKPDIVLIELGGNDGLRGFPIKVIKNNLEKITRLSLAAEAKVLLVGIQIPPNYGSRYTEEFFNTFQLISESLSVPLVPFILDDVAIKPELMQSDGIHPKAEAQSMLVDNIWPYLEPLL
ncbi:multifunctional acyl-CoA thioesterase I/protease I/lysophospholipase L1 [Aurantivibrio infirmus]